MERKAVRIHEPSGDICLHSAFFCVYFICFPDLTEKANRTYESPLKEYLNPLVIGAYGMFFCSVILTMLALKYVPLSMSPILESTGYIFVSVMGYFFLKEKFTKRKLAGFALILAGVIIFNI